MNKKILAALRSELLDRTSIQDLPEDVWRVTGALNTYGTNAIEGNTLTQSEVETVLLKERGVKNRSLQDINETQNHAIAFKGLLSRMSRSIDLVTVQELHEEVFRGVLLDAGRWRMHNVVVAGSFTPPRFTKIIDLMDDWEKEYTKKVALGEDVFQVAAWMHFEFERIHPFSNGNGRVGRLLLNLHFLKHNWPPVHVMPADKEAYKACLRKGHKGNLEHLVRFLEILMSRSLIDLLDKIGADNDELKRLKELERYSKHRSDYLGLRVRQGELPAIMRKGDWQTSRRAINLYLSYVGR